VATVIHCAALVIGVVASCGPVGEDDAVTRLPRSWTNARIRVSYGQAATSFSKGEHHYCTVRLVRLGSARTKNVSPSTNAANHQRSRLLNDP
jgi:hypothetical protein